MSKPNYRVILTFDGDRKVFVARAPELEHCTAEGATRAEAMIHLEEEIDAQLANMLSHGATPPRAVDEEQVTGEITTKVSKALHRELLYQARSEGIELDHLVGELIATAHESRKSTHRTHRGGNRQPQDHVPHDSIGNRHEGQQRGGGRGFGGGRGGGYGTQLLDDRASFMEYVRGLEQQGGGRPGGDRGGGGGGGGGGGRRRRGRGGGGGGRPYDQQRGNQFSGQRNGGGPGSSGGGNQQSQSQMGAASSAPQSGAPPSSGSGEGGENT